MNELKYKKIGLGPSIIIISHEWMGDCSNYDSCLPYLNTKDFTWIFVDLRGYGKSLNIKGVYNLNEAVLDMTKLINNFNTQVTLIGHSMSSLIMQKVALNLKEKIKSLILITPIPPTGIKMRSEARVKLLENVKNQNNVIENVVKNSSKRYTQTWINQRINLAHNCSTLEAKLGYMNMYLTNDFSEEIKGLKTNTLLIVGKYDLPAFHKNSIEKEFKKYYENLTIIESQEAGHYPMIETPILFVSEIEKFIL